MRVRSFYLELLCTLKLLPCDHIQFKQVRRRDQWELSNLITPRPLVAKLFNPMKLIYSR